MAILRVADTLKGFQHTCRVVVNMLAFDCNQNIYRFKQLKFNPVDCFKKQNISQIKKQPLSFQNMISKLWATCEMNFWESEIQGVLE